MRKKLTVYIPKNAPNLIELAEGNQFLAESMKLVFHQIYLGITKIWNRDDEGKNSIKCGAWIALCSKILEALLGSDRYREVLEFMISHGLIEEKMNAAGFQTYAPNRCKRYRIPTHHFEALKRNKLYRKETITDTWLIGKVEKHLEGKGKRMIQQADLDQNLNLKRWVKMTKDLRPVPELVEAQRKLTNSDLEEEMLEHLVEKHQSVGLESFSVDDFGKRSYSHATNVKSSLRSMYRFKGFEASEHVNIDISNSQPYMAGMLLRNPRCIRTLLPEFLPIRDTIAKYSDEADTQRFFDSVRSGSFYKLIAKEANLKLETSEIKKRCFKAIFYGKKRLHPDMENYAELKSVREAFKSLFPHPFETITVIKNFGKETLPFMDDFYYSRKTGEYLENRGSYKNLSLAMQRMETRLVWRVNARLIKLKVTPFTNIHDSWWTIAENEAEVRKQVEIVFNRFGVEPPKLKTTHY